MLLVSICPGPGKVTRLKPGFGMACVKGLYEKNDVKVGFCFTVTFNFVALKK